MNTIALPSPVMSLGERLTRVTRRSAAVVAVLAMLTVGGVGVLLSAAHPTVKALGTLTTPSARQAFRPGTEPWRHGDPRRIERGEAPWRFHRPPGPVPPAAPAQPRQP
jgi:hypothetical protein